MSLPIYSFRASSPSSSMTTESGIHEGLKEYTAKLGAESAFQVKVYRNFLSDYLNGERPYPVPGFTLQCVRNEALRAIRDFRLGQMALLSTIYDPETRQTLANSMQRISEMERDTLAVLTHFHNKALEVERAEILAREAANKLRVRSQ